MSFFTIGSWPRVAAISSKLKASLSGWDNDLWNLRDWYREA